MPSEPVEMSPADFEEVLSLWKNMPSVGLNESDTPDLLSAYLLRNPGLRLVVRHEGVVIAAVLCGHDGRRGYLHHLAVAPEFCRQGLRTALVEQCLTKLGPLGILKCNIFVHGDNHDGGEFWRRTGWLDRDDLRVIQRVIPTQTDLEFSTSGQSP